MAAQGSMLLAAAAACDFAAALAHFACIVIGAPAFRALGAGERMARLAASGHWYPRMVAFAIGGVLCVWAGYALGGAGLAVRLPGTRFALVAIACVLLMRACAFPWLRSVIRGNSMRFWWTSSTGCLALALLHGGGLFASWSGL